ncbi:amino acid transporter [Pontibacillus yanchengensis]|uniref:Amino acid transporter n=2 Tax=Pontibacillus yanchengensis TaxID=462910 RepID=A0ACC7VHQ4_9BACI|nr:LysE family translocator [Pontibacillus yanchengensis]MYL35594.1 amino acid transporter [Pontibacillus yanchengensis]MYL53654.1 amino acid transporter [Pontibacillus yanchengensis]
MSIFFSYIFLGLSLSAPIGPINAAQLDKGIKYGFLSAWLVGIGAMVADMGFMLLIYFGLAQVIMIPIVKTFIWFFGAFVLVYTGIESIKSSNDTSSNEDSQRSSRSFFTGFFMALSNPLNILFWLGIYGSILAKTMDQYGQSQLFFYSSGIFLGILCWDVFMALVASSLQKLRKPKILTYISVIAGLVLIGFGIYFGIQAFKIII